MEKPIRWRLEVDRGICMGSGVCAGIAPDHFQVVDGRSIPMSDEILPDETARDAVEACPMEALRISDWVSGEVIAPS